MLTLKIANMTVSSVASDNIFEGMQRIILRQGVNEFINHAPQAFRDRLKFSGFVLRMKNDKVKETNLAVGQYVDLEATYIIGTTLGGGNNAPLIELAGVTITPVEVNEKEASELPW